MQTLRNARRERGFTLAEITVAIGIFAIIFVATLMIYDQSNKDFKGGVERADLQQNTRVAFEKLVADIRQAGFDYDRDGFPSSAGGAAWAPSRAYGVGSLVSPLSANGFTYVNIQAGTSGASQPVWNTTIGGTTNDGTARWRTEAGINQYQQPDEQIEYAHQRALTLRANLDFETSSAEENGREEALETLQFPVVTTGNDEIVTYALRSVSGPNPNSIDFYADFPDRRSHPGGRAENLVRIPNVDLCTTGVCTSPPYTLYRFTFEDDGDLVESPIATNVREIDFSYYNDTIGTATAFTFTPAIANTAGSSGGGQYNPNLATAGAEARARRAEIKAVRVKLTGMNASKDTQYYNPEEAATSAARNYRTYTLQSLIVPRNLGKMGVRELQDAPPGEPALVKVCSGWCGGVKVEWQAPPVTGETGEIDQYIIIYDTVSPPVRFQKQVGPVTSAFVDDLDPTLRYYFTVAAVNSFGTTTAKTAGGAVETLPASGPGLLVKNATTPEPPSNLLASGGDAIGAPPALENRITLTWSNPINNTGGANETSASCILITGGSSTLLNEPIAPGELDKYEILRGKDPDFDPTDPDEFEYVSSAPPNKIVIAPSSTTFEDNTAVACVDYYYRIRLVERCHPATAQNNDNPARPYSTYFPLPADPAIKGYANASNPPKTPLSLIDPPDVGTDSTCGVDCTIYLQWPKVVLDTTDRTVAVEDYVITRKQFKQGDLTPTSVTEIEVQDTTPATGQYATFGASDLPWYVDSGPALPSVDTLDGLPYQYVYTVRARFDCATELESGESPEFRYPCPYTPTLGGVFVTGTGMVDGDGLTLASAYQTDASGSSGLGVAVEANVVSVQVLLASVSSSTVQDLGTRTAFPTVFPISGTDTGQLYRAYIVAKDTNGCQTIVVRYIEEGTPSGCCLAASADDPLVIQYSQNSSIIDVFLKNQCDNDLAVQANGIRLNWNHLAAGVPVGTKLVQIEYAGESGGRVTQIVNNAGGALTVSLPVGARNPIRAGETLRVQLQFDRILTSSTAPLGNFCVSYQRAGIDDANQNCRIVPEPVTANSCF